MGLTLELNLSKLFATNYISYKGKVNSKKETLLKYKFAICYENARDIPGYITEKIFDAMLSGSVPVYVGCKNITHEVPSECFINAKDFSSPDKLFAYIKNINKVDWELINSKIVTYINSEEFKNKYDAKFFAEELYCELKKLI